MAFEIAESSEDEDYYIVTLGVRPQGDFSGTSGKSSSSSAKRVKLPTAWFLACPGPEAAVAE